MSKHTYGICKETGCGSIGFYASDVKNHGICEVHMVTYILQDLIEDLKKAPHPSEYRGNYAHDVAEEALHKLNSIQHKVK